LNNGVGSSYHIAAAAADDDDDDYGCYYYDIKCFVYTCNVLYS